jgi:hypothetical protein
MALVVVASAVVITGFVVLNVELWGGARSSYYALPVIWLSAVIPAFWLVAADRRLRRGQRG